MKAKTFGSETGEGTMTHAYLVVGRDVLAIEKLISDFVSIKHCLTADISIVEPEIQDGKVCEIKVEQIRALLHDINLSPLGDCRIAIIKGCERLNSSSGNILLKSLEEPPGNVTFILVASSDSVLSTIKSRCRIIKVNGVEARVIQPTSQYPDLLKMDFARFSVEADKIAKSGEAGMFLDDLESHFRYLLNQKKQKSYVSALAAVIEARSAIKHNVVPRLAIEALKLKIESLAFKTE